MKVMLLVPVLAIILSAGALTLLAVVIASIRKGERQLNLSAPARSHAEQTVRRILGVYVSPAAAALLIAARPASIPAPGQHTSTIARHRDPGLAAEPAPGHSDLTRTHMHPEADSGRSALMAGVNPDHP